MNCVICGKPCATYSKKYCPEHKKAANLAFKAMIAEKKVAKESRDQEFKSLFEQAHEAGMAAVRSTQVIPMTVVKHESPIDDASPIEEVYHVPDGVCGFAWVLLRPGTTALARYAQKYLGWRKSYYGGLQYWIGEFGQSYQRKLAYAEAYAKVLQAAGYTAYADGKLD